MANAVVEVAPFFPTGMTVYAYVMRTDSPDGLAPTVSASGSAVVAANGRATFTGLEDSTQYWIGPGTPPYQYIQLQTAPPVSTGGGSGGGGGGGLTTSDVNALIKAGAVIVIPHGADPDYPRPSGVGTGLWVGSVTPSNTIPGDIVLGPEA